MSSVVLEEGGGAWIRCMLSDRWMKNIWQQVSMCFGHSLIFEIYLAKDMDLNLCVKCWYLLCCILFMGCCGVF